MKKGHGHWFLKAFIFTGICALRSTFRHDEVSSFGGGLFDGFILPLTAITETITRKELVYQFVHEQFYPLGFLVGVALLVGFISIKSWPGSGNGNVFIKHSSSTPCRRKLKKRYLSEDRAKLYFK